MTRAEDLDCAFHVDGVVDAPCICGEEDLTGFDFSARPIIKGELA